MSNLCRWTPWNDCQFVDWADCVWYSYQDKKDAPVGGAGKQPSRGGDEEKKTVATGLNYGRKPYLSKSYSEMMRRTPLRATFDQALQKKSQFEKPYLEEDEYPEMQHWTPRFPPPYWGEPGDPWEFIEPVLPPFSPYETGWLCSLNCDGDIGRCGNGGCTDAAGSCYAELVGIGSGGKWTVTGSPYTEVLTGNDITAEQWEDRVHREYVDLLKMKMWMGTSPNSVLQVKEDLQAAGNQEHACTQSQKSNGQSSDQAPRSLGFLF